MPDHLLLEDGGYIEIEGGTDHLIIESSTETIHTSGANLLEVKRLGIGLALGI